MTTYCGEPHCYDPTPHRHVPPPVERALSWLNDHQAALHRAGISFAPIRDALLEAFEAYEDVPDGSEAGGHSACNRGCPRCCS